MRPGRWSAAVVVGWLALTACGVSAQRAPEQVPPDRLPTAAPQQSADAAQARVWVARRERLVPVFVELRRPGLAGRVEALLALGTDEQTLPTAIPAGTRLVGITRLSSDVVRLELSTRLLTAEQREVPLALAQLVLTVTEEPGVVSVEVRVGIQPVTIADDRDRPIQRPLRREDVAVYVDGGLD